MEFALLVVVPDADWEATVDVLLSKRRRSLRLRDLRYQILRHPQRDLEGAEGRTISSEDRPGAPVMPWSSSTTRDPVSTAPP